MPSSREAAWSCTSGGHDHAMTCGGNDVETPPRVDVNGRSARLHTRPAWAATKHPQPGTEQEQRGTDDQRCRRRCYRSRAVRPMGSSPAGWSAASSCSAPAGGCRRAPRRGRSAATVVVVLVAGKVGVDVVGVDECVVAGSASGVESMSVNGRRRSRVDRRTVVDDLGGVDVRRPAGVVHPNVDSEQLSAPGASDGRPVHVTVPPARRRAASLADTSASPAGRTSCTEYTPDGTLPWFLTTISKRTTLPTLNRWPAGSRLIEGQVVGRHRHVEQRRCLRRRSPVVAHHLLRSIDVLSTALVSGSSGSVESSTSPRRPASYRSHCRR